MKARAYEVKVQCKSKINDVSPRGMQEERPVNYQLLRGETISNCAASKLLRVSVLGRVSEDSLDEAKDVID